MAESLASAGVGAGQMMGGRLLGTIWPLGRRSKVGQAGEEDSLVGEGGCGFPWGLEGFGMKMMKTLEPLKLGPVKLQAGLRIQEATLSVSVHLCGAEHLTPVFGLNKPPRPSLSVANEGYKALSR